MMMQVAITVDIETDWGGRQDADEVNYGIEFALPRIASLLEKFNAKATFFVCGEVLERYSKEIIALRDAGHEIGCHGYTHRSLTEMPAPQITEEAEKCLKLFSTHGIEAKGFRAPQGKFNENLYKALVSLGFSYDSSVIRARVPGRLDNTSYPMQPYDVSVDGRTMKEIPISPIPKLNLPLGLLWINSMGFRVFNRLAGGLPERAVFYMHPFDIVYPKPSFHVGFVKRGWYSYRGKDAEKTLGELMEFFGKTRKFVRLSEML